MKAKSTMSKPKSMRSTHKKMSKSMSFTKGKNSFKMTGDKERKGY